MQHSLQLLHCSDCNPFSAPFASVPCSYPFQLLVWLHRAALFTDLSAAEGQEVRYGTISVQYHLNLVTHGSIDFLGNIIVFCWDWSSRTLEVCIEVLKVCAAAALRISATWLNHVLISMSGSLLPHTVLVSLGCLPLLEKQVCVCISVPPFLFSVLLSVMYAPATSCLNTQSLKKTKIN